QAWGKLLEPKPDDLQLGVYAMAIAHGFGDGTADLAKDRTLAVGQAEYWCLAAGAKGVLPFASMRLDKVRSKIDTIVRGMLAGEFDRDPDCTGACATFGQ
ncbi:MAG TPA: PD-(D/E)XK nuclease family protein, partial [Phycisphaerales bacterium]|nr:PD-(D/E)XK nuclease family protein [Phycisphaerales bacterium]